MYPVAQEDYLMHHGVKGMKWGVRKASSSIGRAAKAVDRYQRRKANTTSGQLKELTKTAKRGYSLSGKLFVGGMITGVMGNKPAGAMMKTVGAAGMSFTTAYVAVAGTSILVSGAAKPVSKAIKSTGKVATTALNTGRDVYKTGVDVGRDVAKTTYGVGKDLGNFTANNIKSGYKTGVKLYNEIDERRKRK